MAKSKHEGWDLHTNIKAAPNSQGTLFQGGTDQRTPESRQPRGFSPERFREISQAVLGVRRPGTEFSHAKIRENLARSTVPVEHLSGDDLTFKVGINSRDRLFAAGVYRRKQEGRDNASIEIDPKFANTPSLIHEVGHHVSKQQDLWHAQYYSEQQRGAEEGYADSYATAHWRDRRGGSQPNYQGYLGGDYQKSSNSWKVGYDNTRRTHAEDPRHLLAQAQFAAVKKQDAESKQGVLFDAVPEGGGRYDRFATPRTTRWSYVSIAKHRRD